MEKQYKVELENRDRTIVSLRNKIIEKDQEINVDFFLMKLKSIVYICFKFIEIA